MKKDASNVEDKFFSMLKNVSYGLVLHLLKIGPTSFELDHSPCARMTVTLAKGSILWRCQSRFHEFRGTF